MLELVLQVFLVWILAASAAQVMTGGYNPASLESMFSWGLEMVEAMEASEIQSWKMKHDEIMDLTT